jgi:hypothetical protein
VESGSSVQTVRAISNGKWQRSNGKWFVIFEIANLKPFEFCYLLFAI